MEYVEEYERSKQNCCKDMCRPTMRCFKGLSIVFFIYGFGAFLAALMIYFLTTSHLTDTSTDPEVLIPYWKKDNMRHAVRTLSLILLILGALFWGISVGMFALKNVYKNNLGRVAEDLDDPRKSFGFESLRDQKV